MSSHLGAKELSAVWGELIAHWRVSANGDWTIDQSPNSINHTMLFDNTKPINETQIQMKGVMLILAMFKNLTKKKQILLAIALYPCITIEGLLYYSQLNYLQWTEPYLRKTIYDFKNEKLVKSEHRVNQSKNKKVNLKYYYIPNSKINEVVSQLKTGIGNTSNALYKLLMINYTMIKSPKLRQDMTIRTDIDLHILNSDDLNILTGIKLLNHVNYIHTQKSENQIEFSERGVTVYYPKHVIESYCGKCSNYQYIGIRLNLHKEYVDYTIILDIESKRINSQLIQEVKKKIDYIAIAFNLGYSERYSIIVTINYEKRYQLIKKIHSLFNQTPFRSLRQNYIDYKESVNRINYSQPRDETQYHMPSRYDSYLQDETVYLTLCTGNFKIKELIPVNCSIYSGYNLKDRTSENDDWEKFCESARKNK